MRKLLPLLIVLAIIASGLIVTPAYAIGGESKIVRVQQAELSNVFTFEQLGYLEKLMVGPFDSSSLSFSLPANIKLATGSSLTLKFAVAWSGGSDNTASASNSVAGSLLVYFNDELIDTIVLVGNTPQEKEIAIPDVALDSVSKDGRHKLRLVLNADVNCRSDNFHTTLLVSKTSRFNFQYEEVPPIVDLSLLPRPIYQPDSILPSSVLIVIPDNPEAFELQSALNISAGLGSITNGGLTVKLVENGALTPELVATNHLIFVGIAKKFPNLQVVNLPIAISSDGAALPQTSSADGMIEIGLSPWSLSNVVLYVGGNSDTAVVKASQAFSTGKIIAVEKPDVSLVSAVNPLDTGGPGAVDQSFQSLGYPSQTMGLFGDNYITYDFYVSAEQVGSTSAYIDLVLSHSDLLDYNSTGVTISLNDEVVGSVRLTEESPTIEKVNLVPGVLRRGMNRLEVFSDIIPYYSCYSTALMSTWITISDTSNIHMPVDGEKLPIGENANLRDFPYMFLGGRNLNDLAFILAPNDPTSWDYASQVAYYIGSKGGVPLADVQVAYADNVSDEILSQNNLILFGKASKLPILSKFNNLLPAPYTADSDEAVQPSMLVNYSLLPDTNVGYLQMLPSPWNTDRVILAVMGNTTNGIPMAGATLIKDDLVARLAGNFAVLYADQVVTTDTRLGVGRESIISQLPVAVTVTPAADLVAPSGTGQTIQSRPQWILPLIGIVSVGLLIFLGFMLRKEIMANKKPKDTRPTDDSSTSDLPRS